MPKGDTVRRAPIVKAARAPKNPPRIVHIGKLTLPPTPPFEQAQLDIAGLSNAPDLIRNYALGGPPTPEMVASNEAIDREYERRKLAIIEKYGVADEYLKPLREEELRLEWSLTQVRESIAKLEALKNK